jgi:protein TonB
MLALRGPFSALGGALVAGALFLGLSRLVSVQFDAPPLEEAFRIDFTPQVIETLPIDKRVPKPKREPPVLEPEPTRIGGNERDDGIELVRFERPKIDTPVRGDRVGGAGIDADVIPRVRVNPDYPPQAITRGLEGWVRVRFTVSAIGTVRDAVVVASEPGTTFDAAALKAIARWRYNPRVENGEAWSALGSRPSSASSSTTEAQRGARSDWPVH